MAVGEVGDCKYDEDGSDIEELAIMIFKDNKRSQYG